MRQRRLLRCDVRPGARPAWRLSLLTAGISALVLLCMLITACGPDASQAAAQQNKARLDNELRHARRDLGIPAFMLQPVTAQEQKVAAGDGGWNYNYRDAASNYALLYNQVVGIEQTAAQSLRAQVIADLDAFTKALDTRRDQGFSEASAYQARLDQALHTFDKATTPGDYYAVDTFVEAQTAALTALWPAYLKLRDFTSTLQTMHAAGVNSSLGQTEYTADLQAFRDASSADRYQRLTGVIDGQIMQMMADETEALPYIGSAMLDAFQARIDDLTRWGEDAAPFQHQHDQDATALASAKTLADYLTLAQVVNRQTAAMELPLVRGNARNDLHVLRRLIDQVQASNPLTAYEYASDFEGIGIAQAEFDRASDVAGYQQADNDTVILTTNLRAMLDNMQDPTPAWQAHKADLSGLLLPACTTPWTRSTTPSSPPVTHPARRTGSPQHPSTTPSSTPTMASSCMTPGGAPSSAPAPTCRTGTPSPLTAAPTAASTSPKTTCPGSSPG